MKRIKQSFDLPCTQRLFACACLFDALGRTSAQPDLTLCVSELPNHIEQFDANGNFSLFASGLSYPTGVAFGPDGLLYVANTVDTPSSKLILPATAPSSLTTAMECTDLTGWRSIGMAIAD